MKRRNKEELVLESVEFVMQGVLTALCDPDLPKLRNSFKLKPQVMKDAKELADKGCDLRLLCDCLAFSRRLPDLYPEPPTGVLNEIAQTAGELERNLLQHFPPINLAFFPKDDRPIVSYGPLAGDMAISEEGLAELRRIKRAASYFETVVRCGGRPDRKFVNMVAYLWPVFYVESTTGQPHYERVAALLKSVGFGKKSAAQLATSAKKVRARVPGLESWLVKLVHHLPSEPLAPAQVSMNASAVPESSASKSILNPATYSQKSGVQDAPAPSAAAVVWARETLGSFIPVMPHLDDQSLSEVISMLVLKFLQNGFVPKDEAGDEYLPVRRLTPVQDSTSP